MEQYHHNFSHLTDLNRLFVKSFPSFLGFFGFLGFLDLLKQQQQKYRVLSNNLLSGEIPEEISNLISLTLLFVFNFSLIVLSSPSLIP